MKTLFNADQSERLVRIIHVIDRALKLFEGDKVAAQKWLRILIVTNGAKLDLPQLGWNFLSQRTHHSSPQ